VCNNSGCTDSTVIGEEDLGLVKVGKKVKLLMRIEKDQDRFVFKLDKKGAETPISYTGYSDAADPCADNGGMKRLEVTHLLANCQSEPATYGWLEKKEVINPSGGHPFYEEIKRPCPCCDKGAYIGLESQNRI
jgi:hypothetical protein